MRFLYLDYISYIDEVDGLGYYGVDDDIMSCYCYCYCYDYCLYSLLIYTFYNNTCYYKVFFIKS